MEERIFKFILNHKTMTLASVDAGLPYCSVLFYSFDADKKYLYFVSKESSRHGKEIVGNSAVAGSILREESSFVKLQGIQFTGKCVLLKDKEYIEGRDHFLSFHPLARLVNESMWRVSLDWIKMTDNTLGFGKKIIWERGVSIEEVGLVES